MKHGKTQEAKVAALDRAELMSDAERASELNRLAELRETTGWTENDAHLYHAIKAWQNHRTQL